MEKGKILIIDDETPVGTALINWLTKEEYEVVFVASGEEGLESIENNQYDAVMLDIRMPSVDGLSVLSKIRETDSKLVIIIMTAFPSDDTIDKALALGAYNYITKPFDMDKISSLIEKAVSYSRVMRATEDQIS
ncbi:MAG: response regulator [Candidatus Omnitrophica bacterium]|nr:response regulator [Candidatus Omnitrophota bacterium]